MKSITAGLCLSLIGATAWAQTPPDATPPTKPAAAQPMPGTPPGPSAPGTQAKASDDAPEGEIVETPNGFFLVRPGQGPQPLDIRPPLGRTATTDMPDRDGAPGPARPPRPPRAPPEGKGARFRIHEPNVSLDVKCPDDEPIRACVEAIGALLDKTAAQPHS